jgi:hypothetical protein
MGVLELSKWLERCPQEKAVTVTQEEAECASKLYDKYLNHLQSIASQIPVDPPTEEETGFLVDVIARMARQGKELWPAEQAQQTVLLAAGPSTVHRAAILHAPRNVRLGGKAPIRKAPTMENEPVNHFKEGSEKRIRDRGLFFVLVAMGAILSYLIYDMRGADDKIREAAKKHQ